MLTKTTSKAILKTDSKVLAFCSNFLNYFQDIAFLLQNNAIFFTEVFIQFQNVHTPINQEKYKGLLSKIDISDTKITKDTKMEEFN